MIVDACDSLNQKRRRETTFTFVFCQSRQERNRDQNIPSSLQWFMGYFSRFIFPSILIEKESSNTTDKLYPMRGGECIEEHTVFSDDAKLNTYIWKLCMHLCDWDQFL